MSESPPPPPREKLNSKLPARRIAASPEYRGIEKYLRSEYQLLNPLLRGAFEVENGALKCQSGNKIATYDRTSIQVQKDLHDLGNDIVGMKKLDLEDGQQMETNRGCSLKEINLYLQADPADQKRLIFKNPGALSTSSNSDNMYASQSEAKIIIQGLTNSSNAFDVAKSTSGYGENEVLFFPGQEFDVVSDVTPLEGGQRVLTLAYKHQDIEALKRVMNEQIIPDIITNIETKLKEDTVHKFQSDLADTLEMLDKATPGSVGYNSALTELARVTKAIERLDVKPGTLNAALEMYPRPSNSNSAASSSYAV